MLARILQAAVEQSKAEKKKETTVLRDVQGTLRQPSGQHPVTADANTEPIPPASSKWPRHHGHVSPGRPGTGEQPQVHTTAAEEGTTQGGTEGLPRELAIPSTDSSCNISFPASGAASIAPHEAPDQKSDRLAKVETIAAGGAALASTADAGIKRTLGKAPMSKTGRGMSRRHVSFKVPEGGEETGPQGAGPSLEKPLHPAIQRVHHMRKSVSFSDSPTALRSRSSQSTPRHRAKTEGEEIPHPLDGAPSAGDARHAPAAPSKVQGSRLHKDAGRVSASGQQKRVGMDAITILEASATSVGPVGHPKGASLLPGARASPTVVRPLKSPSGVTVVTALPGLRGSTAGQAAPRVGPPAAAPVLEGTASGNSGQGGAGPHHRKIPQPPSWVGVRATRVTSPSSTTAGTQSLPANQRNAGLSPEAATISSQLHREDASVTAPLVRSPSETPLICADALLDSCSPPPQSPNARANSAHGGALGTEVGAMAWQRGCTSPAETTPSHWEDNVRGLDRVCRLGDVPLESDFQVSSKPSDSMKTVDSSSIAHGDQQTMEDQLPCGAAPDTWAQDWYPRDPADHLPATTSSAPSSYRRASEGDAPREELWDSPKYGTAANPFSTDEPPQADQHAAALEHTNECTPWAPFSRSEAVSLQGDALSASAIELASMHSTAESPSPLTNFGAQYQRLHEPSKNPAGHDVLATEVRPQSQQPRASGGFLGGISRRLSSLFSGDLRTLTNLLYGKDEQGVEGETDLSAEDATWDLPSQVSLLPGETTLLLHAAPRASEGATLDLSTADVQDISAGPRSFDGNPAEGEVHVSRDQRDTSMEAMSGHTNQEEHLLANADQSCQPWSENADPTPLGDGCSFGIARVLEVNSPGMESHRGDYTSPQVQRPGEETAVSAANVRTPEVGLSELRPVPPTPLDQSSFSSHLAASIHEESPSPSANGVQFASGIRSSSALEPPEWLPGGHKQGKSKQQEQVEFQLRRIGGRVQRITFKQVCNETWYDVDYCKDVLQLFLPRLPRTRVSSDHTSTEILTGAKL